MLSLSFLLGHLALVVEFVSHFDTGLCDLFVLLEFLVDVLLHFVPLREEHLPFLDVVNGFVVVGDEVPLDQGTVAHVDSLSSAFGVLVDVSVSQRRVLASLSVLFVFGDEGGSADVFPVGERS